MKAPIKKFRVLYHVGELKAQPAPFSRSSLEGPCLSVSEVPSAWTQIARLGGNPVWELRKKGNAFLDVRRISKKLMSHINDWGVSNGLVVLGECCKTEVDGADEEGNTRIYTYLTLEEAIYEHGEANEDEGEGVRHRMEPMFHATKELMNYAGTSFEYDPSLAIDMLLLAYADKVIDVDGLFWNDVHNVWALSAPRAGIAPGKLDTWEIKLSKTGGNPNEGEY